MLFSIILKVRLESIHCSQPFLFRIRITLYNVGTKSFKRK